MIKQLSKGFTLAALLISPAFTSANAGIINADFETGDLTGWTSTYDGAVTTTFTSDLGTVYAPQSGSYFATLAAGAGEDVYSKLTSSAFIMKNGDVVSGKAAFDNRDGWGFSDSAYVRILDSSYNTVATPWFEAGATLPDQSDGLWTSWSWTATATGTYFVQFGAANNGDNDPDYSSVGLFDAVTVVPEPASMLLMGTGIAALFGIRKKVFNI